MGYEINVSGKRDSTAYEVIKKLFNDTPEKEGKKQEYLRNMMFFVYEIPAKDAEQSEEKKGRPAIIVSSDEVNKTSEYVAIIYLTKKVLEPSPFNVQLVSTTQATAICSKIYTIPKQNIGKYIKKLKENDIRAIDKAIQNALDLSKLEFTKGRE